MSSGEESAEREQLEAQPGSTVNCPICGQVGRVACPKCGGNRTELCSACQGQTFRACDACHGAGWIPSTSFAVRGRSENWKECARCQATGLVDCEICRGRGRDWCRTCEGSGQVACPNCAPARLKLGVGELLAQAILDALWHDSSHARTLLANLQDSSPLADFLWRVGFADRPYGSTRRLRGWVEAHPQDQAGRLLLDLLPQAPYEQLPPRDKPVQLIKKQRPTHHTPSGDPAPTFVSSGRAGDALSDGILAARVGNRDQALVLLLQAVEQQPRSEEAWLWLARLMDTDAQRIECLRRALEINPGNQAAQAEMARLARQ